MTWIVTDGREILLHHPSETEATAIMREMESEGITGLRTERANLSRHAVRALEEGRTIPYIPKPAPVDTASALLRVGRSGNSLHLRVTAQCEAMGLDAGDYVEVVLRRPGSEDGD